MDSSTSFCIVMLNFIIITMVIADYNNSDHNPIDLDFKPLMQFLIDFYTAHEFFIYIALGLFLFPLAIKLIYGIILYFGIPNDDDSKAIDLH